MPDIVLDYHRLKTPIDHPDLSVTRSKLEYPTVNVPLSYLYAIGKTTIAKDDDRDCILTVDVFTDKAMSLLQQVGATSGDPRGLQIARRTTTPNFYRSNLYSPFSSSDHRIQKYFNGAWSDLAVESVDLSAEVQYTETFSINGSTLKAWRQNARDLTVSPTLSATDTSIASGQWGGRNELLFGTLMSPLSTLQPAIAIIEVEVTGSGKLEDPYRPAMSTNLTPISQLTRLIDLMNSDTKKNDISTLVFLYRSARKYEILKAKGFTDDEIFELFGDSIQTHVDLDSVTWGAFELHPDKSPTVIITITGDNPYKSGAIDRQKAKAKRVFDVPKNYDDATALYKQLSKDYPHWLAGKDNFAYQTLGFEIFDVFQNVDFYYGELVEHRTHYDQIKQVRDQELWRRLEELENSLQHMSGLVGVLADERDKHLGKVREIKKRGW